MAQSYVTDAGTLVIPGAYPSIKVQQGASGLSTTGVLFFVGEASAGPDFTLETELSDNAFGPDQLADVVAKYKSGNLVDAFRAAATPANDPDIVGAPNRFVLVKTNPSTKASLALPKIGGGTYASLYDKNYGQLGNLIYASVTTKTAEVKPTTGSFTYIPAVGTVNATLRANGGDDLVLSLVANTTPTAFVSAVDGLAGVSATGGVDRACITVSGTLALAAASNVVVVTRSVAWAVTPTVGDTLVIPAASVLAGGADENVGAYVITAVSPTTVTATKLSDAAKPAAVPGTITAPANVGAASIVSTTDDLKAYSPVAITLEGSTIIDGVGKTLEINQLGTGTDLLNRTAFILGTTSAVTWISATGSPVLLTSSAEYAVNLNVARQVDSASETIGVGGQIALKLGYTGTSCAVVITPTTITLTPVGGSGSTLALAFKDFPTLADLASYINAQTGYKAAVGTTALGQMSPLGLDEGTFACGTDFGNYSLRLKVDAVKFALAIAENSGLIQLGNPIAPAASGLPDTMSTTYLSGGAKGGTTDAIFNSAMDELKTVSGNFVVPLFSRDAASDIADDLTESSSTYTIANVHLASRTHVTAMSTLKKRKNRQAFLSLRDSFENDKDAAANLANYRCSLTFQDQKVQGANGIIQGQPWMGAALAAGMQAAGFYRAIFHKGINCSGVLQAAADFKDKDEDQVEDALKAGLLVAKKSDDGGFQFVSDQTTYLKDNTPYFNSIQQVYVGDIIALTTAQRMEKAFVGQSIADVSAALALTALEGIMADFLRLKLIAVSDDAAKGFKNATIKISGNVMKVSVEVKLAGAIYFIPIEFLVTQVQQSA
jgi:hypothetical protein